MPRIAAESTIEIAAPLDRVRERIEDFRQWPSWSPWLYIERDAHIDYRGEPGRPGHGYDWSGDRVGQGGMTLRHADDTRIDCDLEFLKPFKSHADVGFAFSSADVNQSRVIWRMNSSLPFFLFWMAGSMSGMIASDYRRGLSMLKDLVETGEIPSATEIDGRAEVEAAHYVGVQGTARFEELSDAMGDAFARCAAAVGDEVSGAPFVIYREVNFRRGRCSYVACLPISEPSELEGAATRPACTALRAVHTGAYRHLGNAWSMLMAEARHRKLKPSRQVKPFERYLNDAMKTDERERVTELFLPLKR